MLASIAIAYAGLAAAIDNDASIDQTGSGNVATIDQTGQGGGGVSATAAITQVGSGNSGNIRQDFGSGTIPIHATINSTGNANDATITQRGLDNASATINQTGDLNGATITQDFPDPNPLNVWSDGDTASVTQVGTANSATIH